MAKKRKPRRKTTKPSPTSARRSPKRAAFLAAYAKVGIIAQACRAASCDRGNVYEWMKEPEFKTLMDEAKEEACDALEAEATRRAMRGIDEPVFHQGRQCGTVRRYSDTLLIFLMKAAMPKKYGNRVDVTSGDKPLKLYSVVSPEDIS